MAFRQIVKKLAAVCLVTFLIACTQNSKKISSERTEKSKEHLRVALQALSDGQDFKARSELNKSIELDPLNGRARVTLSSLLAKRAGVELNTWLDPFIDLANKIGKNNELDKIAAESDSNENASDVEKRTEKLLNEIHVGFAAFQVFFEVFRTLPFLGKAQLENLDEAIFVVRNVSVAPTERSEEQRIYQALLGLIRMVSYSKRLLGDGTSSSLEVYTTRFCGMPPSEIRLNLEEMQKSILIVEEGLIVTTTDPQSSQRKSRERIRAHVTKILSSKTWSGLDKFSLPNTLEEKIGEKLRTKVCR